MATKKLSIKLEYKDKEYISDSDNYNEEGQKEVHDFVKLVAEGGAKYMQFQSQNQTRYFPKKILEESIISIVEY